MKVWTGYLLSSSSWDLRDSEERGAWLVGGRGWGIQQEISGAIFLRMDASFIPQSNYGIMDEEESLGSFSSLSKDSSGSSIGSSSPDFAEDTASSGSSSSSSSSKGPLYEMSSLKEQLPFKRGLSKYYQGKSQSFVSFSGIRCLEDLAKPERPLKKLKSSKSCGEGLDSQKSLAPKCCNKRRITKKASRGPFPSINSRRNCFLGSKPPVYPQRSSSISNHTLWFA